MTHPESITRFTSISKRRQEPILDGSVSDENAMIARRLWRATSEADADSIIGLLSPDIVWSTFSSGVLSGSRCGPDEVLDLFARLGELPDQLELEMLDIFASSNGAVIHYGMHAERGSDSVNTQVLLNLRIRDGVIVHALAVPVDAEIDNAFWTAL